MKHAVAPGAPFLLSVVIPAHNESAGIARTVDVIGAVLTSCALAWEMIIVDDGSHDDTFERIRDIARRDPRIKGLRFSRNFGKEAALLAGLRAAQGDAVVTIDADLQHPPALIPMRSPPPGSPFRSVILRMSLAAFSLISSMFPLARF